MATSVNLAKLIDLFDRAARASGFMDFMPSPMIGHFVRQVLPSSVHGNEIRLDPLYQWVRQEYSIPDHVFSRVFSRIEDEAKEMGYQLILPESFNPGIDDAIQGWLKSELKEVVYADLKEEMRQDVRQVLLRELRPEVFAELREQFEKGEGVVPGPTFMEDREGPLPTEDLGVDGIDQFLTPALGDDELRQRDRMRNELLQELRPQMERELREQLGPALCGELRESLETELRPAIEGELREALRNEVESELRASIETRLREELYPVLHETVSSELRAVGHEHLTESLKSDLETKVREELRQKLWGEVREEVKDDLRSVLKPVLEAELRAEVRGAAPARTKEIELLETTQVAGLEDAEVFIKAGEATGLWAELPPAPGQTPVETGPPAPPPLGLRADDQLNIIRQLRAELMPTLREKLIEDLNAIVRAQAEKEERRRRLERLADPDYCLEKIRVFLFPEQPTLWEKVKPLIQPQQWRAIVLAGEREAGDDDERLNRSRQVIREALKIKADVEAERGFPDRMREARGGQARLDSVSAMLGYADDLLDFALESISGILAEDLPDEQLDLTA